MESCLSVCLPSVLDLTLSHSLTVTHHPTHHHHRPHPPLTPTHRLPARLIKLLDIDLAWRLNRCSDGQRRRVQICLGLLKPYQVLLLDEITVDMDVVGRLDLLHFFEQECEERGATVIYATHIFDGLEAWPTHLAYMEDGTLVRGARGCFPLPPGGARAWAPAPSACVHAFLRGQRALPLWRAPWRHSLCISWR